MKNLASTSHATTRQILRNTVSKAPEPIIQMLPDIPNISRSIRHWKSPLNLQEPHNLSEVFIDEAIWITTKGAPFVIYQSPPNDADRTFIFGTQRNLQLLAECKIWLMDSTFKVGNFFKQQ